MAHSLQGSESLREQSVTRAARQKSSRSLRNVMDTRSNLAKQVLAQSDAQAIRPRLRVAQQNGRDQPLFGGQGSNRHTNRSSTGGPFHTALIRSDSPDEDAPGGVGYRIGAPKSKHPSSELELGCLDGEPGDDLLSHGNPHYHRRGVVSRSCSGWEGVVPTRYGHQAMTCRVADFGSTPPIWECSRGCA